MITATKTAKYTGSGKRRSDEDMKKAIDAYTGGATLKVAAETIGVSEACVIRYLRKAGIPLRGVSQAKRGIATRHGTTTKTEEDRVALGDAVKRARKESELIDLFRLSKGECLKLGAKCEFKSCRFRTKESQCALRVAAEGGMELSEIGDQCGFSKQTAHVLLTSALTKLRTKKTMQDWGGVGVGDRSIIPAAAYSYMSWRT